MSVYKIAVTDMLGSMSAMTAEGCRRPRNVYERLIRFTEDAGTIRALQFLMTREITHMKAFTAALESMGVDRSHLYRRMRNLGIQAK